MKDKSLWRWKKRKKEKEMFKYSGNLKRWRLILSNKGSNDLDLLSNFKLKPRPSLWKSGIRIRYPWCRGLQGSTRLHVISVYRLLQVTWNLANSIKWYIHFVCAIYPLCVIIVISTSCTQFHLECLFFIVLSLGFWFTSNFKTLRNLLNYYSLKKESYP